MTKNKILNPNKVLSKIGSFLSKPISLWEKPMIKKYGKQALIHHPVFIIGAPRTGSTILYQAITNIFDVLYIDNLACNFRKNLFFGFCLSKKITKHQAHNSFNSTHGNTENYGFRAPSECGGFWYRWLPKDHHFIDYDEINEKMVKEIRDEITAVSNYFDRPIVFKNLNAGQRLRLLSQCFPDAKYIFIKRNPLLTAQSIYRSRTKLNIPDHTVWGILPKNFKDLEKLEITELITQQIFHLEKQIYDDLELLEKANVYEINYEELDNLEIIDKIKEFISAKFRSDAKSFDIKINNKIVLSREEEKAFKQEINKFDWKKYKLT
jgi:Sulfotransferase family